MFICLIKSLKQSNRENYFRNGNKEFTIKIFWCVTRNITWFFYTVLISPSREQLGLFNPRNHNALMSSANEIYRAKFSRKILCTNTNSDNQSMIFAKHFSDFGHKNNDFSSGAQWRTLRRPPKKLRLPRRFLLAAFICWVCSKHAVTPQAQRRHPTFGWAAFLMTTRSV